MRIHLSARLDYRLGACFILCLLLVGSNCGTEGTEPQDAIPNAGIGADTQVSTGLVTRVSGTLSADDNEIVEYRWSLTAPAGSGATLSELTGDATTFTPDLEGPYVVTLSVVDDAGQSDSETVTITAVDRSSSTTVDATGGEVVSYDGRLRITIPAGALANETEIVITLIAPSQYPDEFAAFEFPFPMEVFDVQPEGLTFADAAKASIGLEGAYAIVGGELTASSGYMLRVGDAGVEPVEEMKLEPDDTDPTTGVLSGAVNKIGPVGVIGGLEERYREAVVRANPPDQAPAGASFDVTVTALLDFDFPDANYTPLFELVGATASDASISPVAPDPAGLAFTDVPLSAQAGGSFSAVLDYWCEAPGQGEWGSTVELEEVVLDVPGSTGLTITLRHPIDCVAPDETPPAVAITMPTSAGTFATGQSTVSLAGTASDDTGVTNVTWENDRGGSGTATGLEEWSVSSISLLAGVNLITVTAGDLAGNSSSAELAVTYTVPGVSERSVSRATYISPGAGGNEILVGGTSPERFDVVGGAVTPLGGPFGTEAVHHLYPMGGGLYANTVLGSNWSWNSTDGWQIIFQVIPDHAQQFVLGSDGVLYGASGPANPRTVGTDFSLDYYTTYTGIQSFWSDGTTDVMIQAGGDGNPTFNTSYPVVADVSAGTPSVAVSGNPFNEVLDDYQRLDRTLACTYRPGDATVLVCLFAGGQQSPGSLVDGQDFVDGTYAIFEVNTADNSGTNLEGSRISGVGATAFSYMGRSGLAWADQEANSIEVREVGTTGIVWSRSIPLGATCTKIFDFTVTPNGEYGVASCWGEDGSGGADDKYVWSELGLGLP